MSKKMKKRNQVTNQMMGIVGNQTIGVVGNQTIGVKAECDHVQIVGTAHFDGHRLFMFQPDDPIPGCVARFRQSGMAQQMSDGTFDFVPKRKKGRRNQLIIKLAHGRASATLDGAIQLTLKVFKYEEVNISETIAREAFEATDAIRNYQLKARI